MADSQALKKTNWCSTETKIIFISYEWKIKNFSRHVTEPEYFLDSPTFTSNEDDSIEWFIRAYPKGVSKNMVPQLSLELHSSCKKTNEQVQQVKFKMSIVKCGYTKYIEKDGCIMLLGKQENYSRYFHFLVTSTLFDENHGNYGILQNDTLTIYCEISYLAPSFHISGKIAETMVPESRLTLNMLELLRNELFSDVVLMVNEVEFKVHKNILAARSPVFAAMLSNDMKEKTENIIHISDMGEETMTDMLHFIYTGEKPDKSNMKLTKELLSAADKYDLGRLKLMCEIELNSKLNIDNAAELLALADLHNADRLKTVALDFVYNNMSTITKASSWLDWTRGHPSLMNDILIRFTQCREKQSDDS